MSTQSSNRFFSTLSSRITLIFLALVIIPISIWGFSVIRSESLALTAQAGSELAARSQIVADKLDVHVGELLHDTRALVLVPELLDVDLQSEFTLLEELHASVLTGYSKFAIIDERGDIQIATPAGPLLNVEHIESFRKAIKGEQAWVIDKALTNDSLVLHMHTPIHNASGQVVSVLGSPVTFDLLAEVVRDGSNTFTDLRVFVLDTDGNPLLSPTDSPLPQSVNYDTLFSHGDGESGQHDDAMFLTYESDGQQVLGGYSLVPSLGWTVVVERPLSQVLEPVARARNSGISTLLILVALTSLFAVGMLRHVLRPLRDLVPVAKALGDGDFDVPLPQSNKTAEVSAFVDAFDTMRNEVEERENRLRSNEEALKDQRSQLARRVKLRTSELEAANQELAKAMQLKDEFVSTMSHELRTPLNAILGLSEALLLGVYDPLETVNTDIVASINRSGEKLLSMVNDVLSIAKVQSGELELEWELVSAAELVQLVMEEAAEPCKKKEIVLQYDSAENDTIITRADKPRVVQILCHLVSNAVKFSDQGAEIGIVVEKDSARRVVNFHVWDKGPGIAQADIERAFKPFQQLDTGLARTFDGAGLGLALARQLAILHGGDITVLSEVGAGSTFTLRLPLRQSNPQPQSKHQRGYRPVILLAEDNELSVQTFTDYLVHYGYDIVLARNGLEALDAVATEIPDLILMDVQMPRMDGLECMRRLRASDKTADLPIIALTGMAMSKDEALCMEAGATEYLSKPISLKLLRERVEANL